MNSSHHSKDVRRETSDVSIGGIGVFVVVFVVSVVVIQGAVWALYRYFERTASVPATVEFPLAETSMRRLPPEPRLQTDPRDDLAHLRRAEDDVLQSYAWIDRNGGVVRIPIERAMELTAERGLPTR